MRPLESRAVSARLLIAAAVAALALGLAACGDDDDSSSDGGTATEAAEAEVDNTDLKKKPAITTTGDESPGALIVEDIVVGKGPVAKSGDQISVQYVGALYSDGTEFDTSWDTGQPFEFELGSGGVIQGWDTGLEGMKVGGRRELVIPPDLAYGPTGQAPTIPPDATLVFVVDLLDVK